MTDSDSMSKRPADPIRAQVEQAIAARYDLDSEIGRGGMGIVYRARDRRLQRPVAIKVLPPDLAFRDDIRSRFLREATTSAQLSHPNIVPIYTVEETGSLVFFIMGYVSGVNLAHYLRDNGVVDAEKSRAILRDVADALAYAHRRSVIHRDIKPDNILLDSDSGRAMVTDFGIARAAHEATSTRLTTTGVAIGTPTYMSPEQSVGDREIDGRSDIYSLGVVGYQLLCGEPPFVALNTPAILVKHLSEQPRPLSERCVVPEDLSAIVMRCLAKDPNDRFLDAAELVSALDGKIPVIAPAPHSERKPPSSLVEGLMAGSSSSTTEGRSDTQPVREAPLGQPASLVAAPPVSPSPAPPALPTSTDEERWNATPVQKFRRRLVTFAIVNTAFLVFAIFGGYNLWWPSGLWTLLLAAWYARLWEVGYDWRDVLRRPRTALLADVVNEKIDETKTLFDPVASGRARTPIQARTRDGRIETGDTLGALTASVATASKKSKLKVLKAAIFPRDPSTPAIPPSGAAHAGGSTATAASIQSESFGSTSRSEHPLSASSDASTLSSTSLSGANDRILSLREASVLRTDILRMFNELSEDERKQLPDIVPSVDALYNRIETLATAERDLSTANVPEHTAEVEREIQQLEADANPLDEEQSEQRVRRLVQLRRQRLSLRDINHRHDEALQKLHRCLGALRTMRLDLVRFRSGLMSVEGVTQIAEQALQLGHEVDVILYAQDELDRVLSRKS